MLKEAKQARVFEYMNSPRVAYILLWFPEPTQTFILDEVNTMVGLGLDLTVYTLYGPRPPQRVPTAQSRRSPTELILEALNSVSSPT